MTIPLDFNTHEAHKGYTHESGDYKSDSKAAKWCRNI
jgi:hypothetical protein